MYLYIWTLDDLFDFLELNIENEKAKGSTENRGPTLTTAEQIREF